MLIPLGISFIVALIASTIVALTLTPVLCSFLLGKERQENKLTKERLMILKESNDGFYVAEQDLKLRGPGDIMGTRQSGEFNFKLADIYIDAATLKLASDTANRLVDDDFLQNEEYHALKERLKSYMNNGLSDLNI